MGNTIEEKAVVDQWMEVESHNFNDLVVSLVLQLEVFPKMGERTDDAAVEASVKKLENVLDVYEQRLSVSKYLAGDHFTIADLCHLPAIMFLMTDGGLGRLITERKCVNSWWNDISGRPSWKKLMELISKVSTGSHRDL